MVSRSWWLVLFLVGCASGGVQPPPAVPMPGKDVVSVAHNALFANGKELTPEFKAIDSFDVSLERREVVFSAKRKDNFDIGLVSLDGSDIHWVPEDPADEVDVRWAPRGNKVSYIVRAIGGDLVRTVHIPTAMQLSADFPYARVHSVVWDADAERYSVKVTSPDASERTESLKYDGTARKTIVAPADHLDIDVESFGRNGVMLRPQLLRYNEQLPLVIWVADQPLEWNAARGALMKNNRIAVAVVKEVPEELPDLPWIDSHKIFLVSKETVRRRTPWIAVPHADVESLAARWIAQHLKDVNGRR